MTKTIKCDGCEREMRQGSFLEVSGRDGGTYILTYSDDTQERVHYCFDCRDIVVNAINTHGHFETIEAIDAA